LNNNLGEYIKKVRVSKDLSLREFGNLCGISHTHIDSIEKGVDFRTGKPVRITNETLEKLSNVLSVTPSFLLKLSLGETIEQSTSNNSNKASQSSSVPPEFIVLARKAGDMPEEDREQLYKIFNSTIDTFLEKYKEKHDKKGTKK